MVSGRFLDSSATDGPAVSLRGILTVLGFRRTYCIHRCTSLDTREMVPKNGPTFNGQGTLGLYVVYLHTRGLLVGVISTLTLMRKVSYIACYTSSCEVAQVTGSAST